MFNPIVSDITKISASYSQKRLLLKGILIFFPFFIVKVKNRHVYSTHDCNSCIFYDAIIYR